MKNEYLGTADDETYTLLSQFLISLDVFTSPEAVLRWHVVMTLFLLFGGVVIMTLLLGMSHVTSNTDRHQLQVSQACMSLPEPHRYIHSHCQYVAHAISPVGWLKHVTLVSFSAIITY